MEVVISTPVTFRSASAVPILDCYSLGIFCMPYMASLSLPVASDHMLAGDTLFHRRSHEFPLDTAPFAWHLAAPRGSFPSV